MAEKNRVVNTNFPVFLPEMGELKMTKEEFETYLIKVFAPQEVKAPTGTTLPIHPKESEKPNDEDTAMVQEKPTSEQAPTSAFIDALNKAAVPSLDEYDDKMLTQNGDVAFRTSGQALVDLFFEMEEVVQGDRLRELLETAWAVDKDATLKIIWNARSIHLGKSSRNVFYRAVGWLYENHPHTLFANLAWLVRPLIAKRAPKSNEKQDEEKQQTAADTTNDVDDFEIIDAEEKKQEPAAKRVKIEDDAKLSEFDVKFGVAHGYWKDLLNILALAANDELSVNGDPRKVLNIEKPSGKPYKRDWSNAKDRKRDEQAKLHQQIVELLTSNDRYKALHLTVARLFAEQIRIDTARQESGAIDNTKHITLAAKWAPSHKGMHDRQTIITSSIAELLHPFDGVCGNESIDPADRTAYLKYAREAYQKTLSSLRKFLRVVERDITEEAFDKIDYSRVPSLAMKQYTSLFIKKDFENFDKYLDNVVAGQASISGATLLPSTLIHAVSSPAPVKSTGNKEADRIVAAKQQAIRLKAIEGQWNTLVQRIKDSGTLENSIAVCDVSGSMTCDRFPDGTTPIESSIGLSLLIAEVTKPPFGGSFITFSDIPQVMKVGGPDDERSLAEKVDYIERSNWSMTTNFTSVFKDLILHVALRDKLKQEDLPKQVFVFSDMQFNAADRSSYGKSAEDCWSTSFERIQQDFKNAGYEMPTLIFWNLAGGAGDLRGYPGEPAPKPVTAAEEGTALVSGYSQGQLKMFLEKGTFEDAEEEMEMKEDENGKEVVVEKKKAKMDPLMVVKKAISHEAYRMLKVMD